MKPLVFCTMPRYSEMVVASAQRTFLACTRGKYEINFGHPGIGGSPVESQISVLPKAFNAPWCMALSLRKTHKIRAWYMQHADVECVEYASLDTLIPEMERVGADVLSVVVPIKTADGLTSTAVTESDWPDGSVGIGERSRKLTMHEVLKLPKTFSIDDVAPGKVLLVNTGCFVCDFTKPWVEKITFDFHHRNYEGTDGNWHCASRGEDYDFSLQCHRLGLKVFATTLVKVHHHGSNAFPNYQAWGQERDEAFHSQPKAE